MGLMRAGHLCTIVTIDDRGFTRMMTDRVNSKASWMLTAHKLPLTALYLMSQCNA